MPLGNYFRKNVIVTGLFCLAILFMATGLVFMYLSDAFKPEPVVTIHADNNYDQTLRAVTDSDYEPFSYIRNGEYLGMDVELIAEIANRLHMNLDLKLTDWTSANELFNSGQAEAFLNMETDSVANSTTMISTLPTVEKQYVVYGKENVSSVAELYDRKVVSLHKLPELGLGDGIKYLDSYEEIFNELKKGTFDFAICPIQVGNVFLEKLNMTEIHPSYAVAHIYGAIALKVSNISLKNKIDSVISDLVKEGFLVSLERKWISHRYQSMTLTGMIKSHPEVLAAFFAVLLLIVLLLIYLKTLSVKNEELLTARQKAEESSRAKSEFLANMSHEIRTPINAVLGMNEMIIRESHDENIMIYARSVESAGKNLLSIINDILDFSKIEAGKMEIVNADYKLSSVLSDVSNMIVFKAKQKDLRFDVEVDETLPDELSGDEVRVRQVVTNVLNNAVKYTREGSVLLKVNGERSNDKLILKFTVKDTGIGIKSEDLAKLFNKFERVDLEQNSTVEGTGLGLSITQNLLKLMGGSIEVSSEYGKGSTFTITIPQKIISDEKIGNFQEKFEKSVHNMQVYHESFRAPDAKILVVDDTAMNLTVIQGLLGKTEINLDTAGSGAEALTLTKKTQYDLIFMDQRMPQMGGTETLIHIREQVDGLNRETPVICLTADAVSGARAKYLEEGFTDYLSKPVESSAIEAILIKYLPAEKVILQNVQDVQKVDKKETEISKLYAATDGLNYDDAIKFCSNEELLSKTLEQFYRSIEANSDEIENFFKAKDYENYTIKVHALKSSARLIGAMSLSEQAKYLEECGNEKAVDEIESLTPELLEDYRSYREKLSPLYAAEEAERENAPEISQERLNEAYEAIREFAASFDIDSIDSIVESIRQYRIPSQEAKRFNDVETAVRNMDWAGLEAALGEEYEERD